MPNVADHVTSFELSMKLKEAGFPQDSLFYWFKCLFTNKWIIKNFEMIKLLATGTDWEGNLKFPNLEIYSAYTASELMEVLPPFIKGIPLFIKKFDDFYECGYFLDDSLHIQTINLAQSLGEIALKLTQNNLMELPK